VAIQGWEIAPGDRLIFHTTFCQSWYSPASGVSAL
jgi:hypothetical protein